MRSACSPSSPFGPTPRSIPMPCGRRSSGAARPMPRCRAGRRRAASDVRPRSQAARAAAWYACRRSTTARCPRCGSTVHERKPDSLTRTWAFVIAGAVLYIPANVYPVLTVIQLGAGQPSTIMGGVEELLASKMYPLALLVFFASIMVPMFKLIGLASHADGHHDGDDRGGRRVSCCASARRSISSSPGSGAGRWSTSSWSRCWARWCSSAASSPSSPAWARVAFCAVVFITIFAAEAFDPRLMWDAAARNAHRPMALAASVSTDHGTR